MQRVGSYVYVPGLNRLTTVYHLVFNEHRYYDRKLDRTRVSFSDRSPIADDDTEGPIGQTKRQYVEPRDHPSPRRLRERRTY